MKKNTLHQSLIATIVILFLTFNLVGCWYETDDERHPTDPDRTGVQGWTVVLTVRPATVPANGNSTMIIQAKLWNLQDRTAVPNMDIYLSLMDISGAGALPQEICFADGSVTHMVRTDGLGLATIPIYAGYIPGNLVEKNYYVRAEVMVDLDNNAVSIWNTHTFRLYNPYYHGVFTPTPYPGDKNPPQAVISVRPEETTSCEEMTFDGSLSYDTDYQGQTAYDEITAYYWYFGDGSSAQGKVVKHQYSSNSDFTVQLVVIDDEGLPGSTSRTVTVGGCK